MFSYIWPVALVVLTGVIYHITTKSVPGDVNPFASLVVTYLISAVVSAAMFFLISPEKNLATELSKVNWASYALGLAIVFLEVGSICAYKAGWTIGTFFIVQSAITSVFLVFIGNLLYGEPITWKKIAGTVICMIGLGFINM